MDNTEIIKDNLYYDERSAGGIVYKMENGKVRWLVVKYLSRGIKKKSGKQEPVFKFPKGHLKDNEVLKQAAQREVEEEGRVKGKIVSKIGSNDYIIWDKLQKKKIIKKVTFFLMEYAGESNLKYYDTEVVLDRVWMEFKEATEKLAFDSEKVLLRKAGIQLEQRMRK
jgi:ADP-ribose pyrophosphatase YjhB (NUDIX family)